MNMFQFVDDKTPTEFSRYNNISEYKQLTNTKSSIQIITIPPQNFHQEFDECEKHMIAITNKSPLYSIMTKLHNKINQEYNERAFDHMRQWLNVKTSIQNKGEIVITGGYIIRNKQ
jgi:hypothetical protein